VSPSLELAGFHTAWRHRQNDSNRREQAEKARLSNNLTARLPSWHKRCDFPFIGFQRKCTRRWSGHKRRTQMLWTIFVILLILWLVGVVSSYTLGGFVHLLLVIALVVLLINLISGRRPVV
jgi:Flp pilus assembly protein TadB